MSGEHATAVDLQPDRPDGLAVLLRGPSGIGKSDLALRLIDAGARLVADDRVELAVDDGVVRCRPPPALAGLLEVRGLGIVRLPWRPTARLALVVELVPAARVERLPEPRHCDVLGIAMPCWRLAPLEPSAAARIRMMALVAERTLVLR